MRNMVSLVIYKVLGKKNKLYLTNNDRKPVVHNPPYFKIKTYVNIFFKSKQTFVRFNAYTINDYVMYGVS